MVSNSGELRPGKLSPGKLIPGKLRPGKLGKELAVLEFYVIKLLESLRPGSDAVLFMSRTYYIELST